MKSIVELVSVSRVFGRGPTAVEAVKEATVTVAEGQTLAIMGPSGSGKSTLLSVMAGLLEASGGEVMLCGQPLRLMKEAARARQRRFRVGFVFQNFNLLAALTAVENVEVSLCLAGYRLGEAGILARKALAEVGLRGREEFLPRQLSGGQQQRVALARALAPLPSLILADEPTGSLDSVTGKEVLEVICAHAHERSAAAIIVSHDLRLRNLVDRCLWMEDGVLLESADRSSSGNKASKRELITEPEQCQKD